jgi:DNA-binding response OmpR family regulator
MSARRRLLCIQDDEETAALLREALEEDGYEARIELTGSAASKRPATDPIS